jgi:hypothetical protein
VFEVAREHGVEPLVASELLARPLPPSWPQTIRETAVGLARAHATTDAYRSRELQRVLEALGRRGAAALLMKGAALAHQHYSPSWTRHRLDSDLFIRKTDLPAVAEVMRALGYAAVNSLAGDHVTQQHAFVRRDPPSILHALDVHWRLTNRPLLADTLSFDECQRASVAVPELGAGARALGPVHALVLACLHPVAHHSGSDRLIWLADVHRVVSAMSAQDLRAFASFCAERRVQAICGRALAMAREYFSGHVPADLIREMSQVRGEPSAIFLDARTWRGDIRLSDLRTVPGWKGKLGLVRDVAFPNADYIRREYGPVHPAAIPAVYAYRIVRGTWRLLGRMAHQGSA